MSEERWWYHGKKRPFLVRAKEKVKVQNGYAESRGSYGDLTIEQWLKMLDDSQGHCRYCKQYIGVEYLTMDHVIPDGPTTESNIVVACRSCNSSKGRKLNWNRA
jgi:5-methylcytosine-specific restriction endonuclease McrA